MIRRNAAVFLISTLFASAALAQDKELVETARNVHKASENAVVSVSATLKITAEGAGASVQIGGGSEKHMEINATVVDAAGLAVGSLAGLDPTYLMTNVKVDVGGERRSVKLNGQLSDIKMRLADGTEVAGRLVLKDEEQDLAFIAPARPLDEAGKAKLASVSVADASKGLDLLDSIIEIGRLGKEMNYQSTVRIGRVAAKVTTPRTFYVGAEAVGCPVFDAAGKLAGIVAVHHKPEGAGASGGNLSIGGSPVIIPAGDIADLISQAKEEAAKPVKTASATKPD
jgi:S1-C subfamily serine protease